MSKVRIIIDDEKINDKPTVLIDNKEVRLLHDIHFDWNTKTGKKDTSARLSISYWNMNHNLITKESYTSAFLGNNFDKLK